MGVGAGVGGGGGGDGGESVSSHLGVFAVC